MKKFVKNTFLAFVICFTILNIIGIIFNTKNYHNTLYREVGVILQGELNNEISERENNFHDTFTTQYGENTPVATLAYMQGYLLGQENILQLQQVLVITSGIIGISIGLLISLTKKSKIKEIILFIGIGFSIAIIYTIYIYIMTNHIGGNFWEEIIEIFARDFIMQYGIYYVISYLVIYLVKYFIGKKNAKELNNLLHKE